MYTARKEHNGVCILKFTEPGRRLPKNGKRHPESSFCIAYGLLSLNPLPSPMTPPTPPPRFTSEPEVINSWELMAGLDPNSTPNPGSFRFSPLRSPFSYSNFRPSNPKFFGRVKDAENANPNIANRLFNQTKTKPKPKHEVCALKSASYSLEDFPSLCPPDGENKVVLYTTSLRGIRRTFEACNAVRSVLQGLGYSFCERDISMDRGFRDELKRTLLNLPKTVSTQQLLPPRLFIKDRYVGAAEEVLRIHKDGGLLQLLRGLPRVKIGNVCDGCGDARFLPYFQCNGSCKLVYDSNCKSRAPVVTRCPDCNENGLALCPICS